MIASLLSAIDVIGRGLRDAFYMFWETLWALVLGFSLSGVVQSFVSREQMRARLGDHGPRSVARASGYGMASSSCSYAASAMARSLFSKGADFTSSMVFMFASTNLVVELGIVLLVLMGWQFTAAEFVGGPIMIVLLAVLGGIVFAPRVVAGLRSRIATGDSTPSNDEAASTTVTMRDLARWADAATYAVADVRMLRRELVIGYLVAGMLAAAVPQHAWSVFFLHGHGWLTQLENALVGPLVAIASWVCSVGNVPLAATLWSSGISFGGVVAFLFADLISMPLLLVYRRMYGGAMTWRMLGVFYPVIVLAGLATQAIFSAGGWIPARRTIAASGPTIRLDATSVLNVVFLVLAFLVVWLSRNARRFGAGQGYAIDPVCGMQVRVREAPASSTIAGVDYFFCSDRCKDRFDAEPHRYLDPDAEPSAMVEGLAVDPICGMQVDPSTAAATRQGPKGAVYFCSLGCAEAFDALGSDMGAAPASEAVVATIAPRRTSIVCPTCSRRFDPSSAFADARGDARYCSESCATQTQRD